MNTEEKVKLATTIASELRGVKIPDIDEILEEARGIAYNNTSLADFFETQITTLKSLNCPPEIIKDNIRQQQDEVLFRAAEMDIPENHIPFLVVIPRMYLGISGLMYMVRNGNNAGFTHFQPHKIANSIKVPDEVYFIFDVENGSETLGNSPKKAESLIAERQRLGLTFEEGVSLCIHSSVLSVHNLYCLCSYFDRKNTILKLLIGGGDRPCLWHNETNSHTKVGTPSCAERLSF